MVRKQKLYQRLVNSQRNVKFNNFVTVIESFGFALNRITGSHHIYDHPQVEQSISIQPDKNNQAKVYQVRQFLRLVEKYNLQINDSEESDDE